MARYRSGPISTKWISDKSASRTVMSRGFPRRRRYANDTYKKNVVAAAGAHIIFVLARRRGGRRVSFVIMF